MLTSPEDAVLAGLDNVYVACPDTPLYDVPCITCRCRLASRPFVFHVLIMQEVCPSGLGHVAADAAVCHADCNPGSFDDLCEAMLAVLDHDDAA